MICPLKKPDGICTSREVILVQKKYSAYISNAIIMDYTTYVM